MAKLKFLGNVLCRLGLVFAGYISCHHWEHRPTECVILHDRQNSFEAGAQTVQNAHWQRLCARLKVFLQVDTTRHFGVACYVSKMRVACLIQETYLRYAKGKNSFDNSLGTRTILVIQSFTNTNPGFVTPSGNGSVYDGLECSKRSTLGKNLPFKIQHTVVSIFPFRRLSTLGNITLRALSCLQRRCYSTHPRKITWFRANKVSTNLPEIHMCLSSLSIYTPAGSHIHYIWKYIYIVAVLVSPTFHMISSLTVSDQGSA